MPNTYTQIHIHAVFTVQNRLSLITDVWRERLYQYITNIVQSHEHKLLVIGGMPDHVHMLFGMRPTQSLSDLMQDVKSGSSGWINKQRFVEGMFSWQEGYGAFSYSRSQLPQVIRYIENQAKHHEKVSFLDEYKHFLESLDISFDERYIFKPVE